MKQQRISILAWAVLMLLPLSCTQKENEPHAPLPADILGMWMPTSEASVSGTDRYVEFADGQCYSYVSYDNHSVRNGYIVTTTSPFSLVNSRYCHLAANGNLIIGNKDMGKLTFINEFGGEQQKVMIIGSERYLPLKGFTSSDDARPRFSAIEILHYGTESPIEKVYQMHKGDTAPLKIRLYKTIREKGDDGIITEKVVEETDPKVVEDNTEWVYEDWRIASVNNKNVLIGLGYGSTRIKARTKDLSCADYFDAEVLGGGELSAQGTANCYVVSAPGHYSFLPTRGNDATVLNIQSAYIQWETYLTDQKPAEDLITNLKVNPENGKIEFDVPAKFKNGNVLVVGKAGTGSSSQTLWSWHLWLCEDYEPDLNAQNTYNFAGVLMDRYLGALSTEPSDNEMTAAGLLYQWGRKDPFIGAYKCTKREDEPRRMLLAKYLSPVNENIILTTEWAGSTDAINYTIEHPNRFLAEVASQSVWMGDAHKGDPLWSSVKTIYDPCPPGWRVMTGGNEGVFAKALGTNPDPDSFSRTSNGVGFDLGELMGPADHIVFPWTSYLQWDIKNEGYAPTLDDEHLEELPLDRNYRSAVWTAFPKGYSLYGSDFYYGPMVSFHFGMDKSDCIIPAETETTYRNKSNAYPVRCMKEN